MSNEATIQKMQMMKFFGMSKTYRNMIDTGLLKDMASGEVIAALIDSEYDRRCNKKLERLIKDAKFRFNAGLNDITYQKHRKLDKNIIFELSDCNWIKKGENIIVTGATGVGKSFIACSIGNQACLNGYRVMYMNSIKMFGELKLSKNDGSYSKILSRILKNDLLIIDDFGLHPIDNVISMILLEILEERYEKKSIMISSQYAPDSWFSLIPDKTHADAICDRLIHNSKRIDLEGESMRKIHIKKSDVS